MQNLIEQISKKTFVTPELRSRIENDFEIIETTKKDLILEEGRQAHYLYFVEKGILHNFYYHDGKQITSWFYEENQFISAWYSFYYQKPSFESIECLEDSILYRISFEKQQHLIHDFPAYGNFARILSEEMLATLDYFSKNWSFLTAQEKYVSMKTYFPQIELRVKLGLIASFLGISQETLSRIRSRK